MSVKEIIALGDEAITIDTTELSCAYRIEGLTRLLRRHYVRRGQDRAICGAFVGGPDFAHPDQVPDDAWGCEERPCESCVRGLA